MKNRDERGESNRGDSRHTERRKRCKCDLLKIEIDVIRFFTRRKTVFTSFLLEG